MTPEAETIEERAGIIAEGEGIGQEAAHTLALAQMRSDDEKLAQAQQMMLTL